MTNKTNKTKKKKLCVRKNNRLIHIKLHNYHDHYHHQQQTIINQFLNCDDIFIQLFQNHYSN